MGAVDVKALEKLVADLDSAKFTTREKAAKALEAAGEAAIVPLQRCLEKSPSVEVQRRATLLLKKIGEPVEKDEPLFEISTDKVDAEIPSPVTGVLTEIKFPEGATVEINTVAPFLALICPLDSSKESSNIQPPFF